MQLVYVLSDDLRGVVNDCVCCDWFSMNFETVVVDFALVGYRKLM